MGCPPPPPQLSRSGTHDRKGTSPGVARRHWGRGSPYPPPPLRPSAAANPRRAGSTTTPIGLQRTGTGPADGGCAPLTPTKSPVPPFARGGGGGDGSVGRWSLGGVIGGGHFGAQGMSSASEDHSPTRQRTARRVSGRRPACEPTIRGSVGAFGGFAPMPPVEGNLRFLGFEPGTTGAGVACSDLSTARSR